MTCGGPIVIFPDCICLILSKGGREERKRRKNFKKKEQRMPYNLKYRDRIILTLCPSDNYRHLIKKLLDGPNGDGRERLSGEKTKNSSWGTELWGL